MHALSEALAAGWAPAHDPPRQQLPNSHISYSAIAPFTLFLLPGEGRDPCWANWRAAQVLIDLAGGAMDPGFRRGGVFNNR
jgi:hypothetical protein